MELKRAHLYFSLLGLLVILSCQRENNTVVATSANMQFAMEQLINAYTRETNEKIDLVVASSGKLTFQIEQGAPYDIFVAANTFYPDYLHEKGFSKTVPKIYAEGQLLLYSNKNYDLSLELLKTNKIKKIAIANPKTAPYGMATIEYLKKEGSYNEIKHKFVFGESISQVNHFVKTKAVDIGFTTQAIKYSLQNNKSGAFLELKNAPLIPQSAILINPKKASAFYDFIYTDTGKEILNRYGYKTKALSKER